MAVITWLLSGVFAGTNVEGDKVENVGKRIGSDLDGSLYGGDVGGTLSDDDGMDRVTAVIGTGNANDDPASDTLGGTDGNEDPVSETSSGVIGPNFALNAGIFGDGQVDTLDFVENLARPAFGSLFESNNDVGRPLYIGGQDQLFGAGGKNSFGLFGDEQTWDFAFGNLIKNGFWNYDFVTIGTGSNEDFADDANPDPLTGSGDVGAPNATDDDLLGNNGDDGATSGDDSGTPNGVGDDGVTNIDDTSADPDAGVVPDWAANLTDYWQYADDFITI
jgi:hypothetical protein